MKAAKISLGGSAVVGGGRKTGALAQTASEGHLPKKRRGAGGRRASVPVSAQQLETIRGKWEEVYTEEFRVQDHEGMVEMILRSLTSPNLAYEKVRPGFFDESMKFTILEFCGEYRQRAWAAAALEAYMRAGRPVPEWLAGRAVELLRSFEPKGAPDQRKLSDRADKHQSRFEAVAVLMHGPEGRHRWALGALRRYGIQPKWANVYEVASALLAGHPGEGTPDAVRESYLSFTRGLNEDYLLSASDWMRKRSWDFIFEDEVDVA